VLNEVKLIGNLGADPEVRTVGNGNKVANLRIATSERWKDRDGNRQEKTEWHSVVIWGDGLVGVVERFLKKGSKVYLCGKLQTRKWQDQSGADRYSTEVVLQGPKADMQMLDGKPDSGGGDSYGGGSGGGYNGGTSRSQSRPQPAAFDTDLDDDVPF
jgi:single-strand DNA-binding protein